jgi:hypothetical protein
MSGGTTIKIPNEK